MKPATSRRAHPRHEVPSMVGAVRVELVLPQLEAQGLAVGQAVELHPAGKPGQTLRSRLSWDIRATELSFITP